MRKSNWLAWICSWSCAVLVLGVTAAGGTAAGEDSVNVEIEFYNKHVQPVLSSRCFKCHGPETQEGGLRLDTYEGIRQGGSSGELVDLKYPDESLLLVAVSYKNEDLQMPPDAKLAAEEIDALKKWVEKGLPHPAAPKKSAAPVSAAPVRSDASTFWAFQPPVAGALPTVKNRSWPRTPIDRFLLAALESRGLAPQAVADKRVLIRRLSFDLTGLPPTPEEVESFLGDDSPSAYERLVDRLLASPRYGERWGRHWLDIARYADSNGQDENVAYGNAWRYRDYVIASLNRDQPFDQFVREQIAGDLLTTPDEELRRERLVATGFLSLGAKVLAEVDELKMEMDIVDEQIDTIGRAILGLTLGCARCHDHKFDPIRTEDYYSLAGIFRSTKTMESFTKVARWNEIPIPTPEELAAKREFDKEIADRKSAIQSVIDHAKEELQASVGAGATLPKDPEPMFPAAVQSQLKKMRAELAKREKAAPAVSTVMGVTDGQVIDTEICLRGSHLTRGRSIPRGVPAVLANQPLTFPASESGRRELADWLVNVRQPLTARVLVNRIWRWHFGRGLVESTDNFGLLGDRPVNQPLLDWLAVWMMDQGWSIKGLHRLIVTSAAYRQASHYAASTPSTAAAELADPENRLLWHFPARRLEAESIRDALLSVTGELDTTMGGSLLHIGNRQYFFDHTSKDTTKYDAHRRAVYLPVVRNNLYDMFQLFDSTDATVPNGDRASSTVATQALFLLNSPFVMERAKVMANNLLAASANDAERTRLAYEACFGRPPLASEISQCAEFLRGFATGEPLNADPKLTGEVAAWSAFCQMLLVSNEFVYLK